MSVLLFFLGEILKSDTRIFSPVVYSQLFGFDGMFDWRTQHVKKEW